VRLVPREHVPSEEERADADNASKTSHHQRPHVQETKARNKKGSNIPTTFMSTKPKLVGITGTIGAGKGNRLPPNAAHGATAFLLHRIYRDPS
jgi:hypothetical protein